jgi:hypothetical protein
MEHTHSNGNQGAPTGGVIAWDIEH